MHLYCEEAPNASLTDWVECVWRHHGADDGAAHPVAPDGCLDIIYFRGQGLRAVGAMTIEQRFHFPKNAWVTGVRFRPGMARSFFGLSAAELTGGLIPLEAIWDRRARELERHMDDASDPRRAMRILRDAVNPPNQGQNAVQQALRAMAAAHGTTNLDKLALQANLSARQFRRRCLEESGLAPKHLARILRFRHASALARKSERRDWAAIAAKANYFDQAHLIRDFREFTGSTPMSVLSNTPDRPQL